MQMTAFWQQLHPLLEVIYRIFFPQVFGERFTLLCYSIFFSIWTFPYSHIGSVQKTSVSVAQTIPTDGRAVVLTDPMGAAFAKTLAEAAEPRADAPASG